MLVAISNQRFAIAHKIKVQLKGRSNWICLFAIHVGNTFLRRIANMYFVSAILVSCIGYSAND